MWTTTSPWFWLHFPDDWWCWASPHMLTGHCACGLVTRLCVLAARALCCSARGTSLVAPWHVGSSFPNEGLNLRPLHWTTRKTSIIHLCMYLLSGWMSIQTLCPLDDFLWLSCKNSFYNIPDTSPDQIYFWSTNTSSYLWVVFSLSWWCPTKQLIFWNSMILFFSFLSYLRDLGLIRGHRDLSLGFLLTVSVLVSRSLVSDPVPFFCVWISSSLSTVCLRDYLPHPNRLGTSFDGLCESLFLDSQLCSMTYMSVLTPEHQTFFVSEAFSLFSNWEVYIFQLCSSFPRRLWLFWVPWISVWIMGWACQLLQRN